MKNSFAKTIIAIATLFTSIVAFAATDCSQHQSPSDKNNCYKFQVNDAATYFIRISERLYQDTADLGLTDEERVSVKNYYKEVVNDSQKRCGQQEHTCKYNVFATGYQELRAFEDQKLREKEKRHAAKPIPKFGAGQISKSAPAQKPSSQYAGSENGIGLVNADAQEEIDAKQPKQKSYVISDKEAAKKAAAATKYLNSIKQKAPTEEEWGD